MQRHLLLAMLPAVVACSSGSDDPPAALPPTPTNVVTSDMQVVAEISERYLSIAVDSAQVVGGVFWSPDGRVETTGVGSTRVPPYDFGREKLRNLAGALAPAWLRIGGSEADRVFYALGDDPPEEAPEGYEEVMTRAQWEGIADFAKALDYQILFTLNAGLGPRDEDKNWVPDHARALIELAAERGDPVPVWELGNEPNAFRLVLGPEGHREPEELAADYRTMRALVKEIMPDASVAGPASAWWPMVGEIGPVYPDFMPLGGDQLDIVTWHYYPQQSKRCPFIVREATAESTLLPETLDEIQVWAAEVELHANAHAPGAEIWLGESGGAQCGGAPGVSDRFVGTFWWLDQLAILAKRNHEVMIRQNLSGSDYGIIDELTLTPNPDYWASLLWRRLMGQKVLSATKSVEGDRLRAYAHCARDGIAGSGAVTLLLLNTDPLSTSIVDLAAFGAAADMSVYLATSDALDSKAVVLNGVALSAGADGTPPPFTPETPAWQGLELPPASWAFVVAAGAGAASCP